MISTMMTRHAPATNRQALWIASIARIYRSFMEASCVRTIGEPARSLDRPASRHAIRRSFHVLNALDQLGVLFAVFLPHRLDRFLERLFVVDLDDLDARFLHVALRLLLHRVPKLALLLLRFFGKFGDQCLVVLLVRVP